MIRVKKLTIAFIVAIVALVAFVSSASAAAPNVNSGTATVDGKIDEWTLGTSSPDYFAPMYLGWNKNNRDIETSKIYLRYHCSGDGTGTMYVLVMNNEGIPAVPDPTGNAWIKIDGDNSPIADDAGHGTFAWVVIGGQYVGYEASFPLSISPTADHTIIAHIEVKYESEDQTSGTLGGPDTGIPLTLTCPPTPPEYDLYLNKAGPEYIFVDDTSITYTIMVGNNGPSSVARSDITITDKTFSQTIKFDEEGSFVKGDSNTNGLLDPGEMWQATFIASVTGLTPDTYITNTACVGGPEGGDTDLTNNCDDASVYVWWYGYTPGYWKNHPEAWGSPYATTTKIGDVFTSAPASLQSNTFMTALSYKGGTGTEGAAQILLRAAVAAVMNENKFEDGYPPYDTVNELISAVNAALASNDRTTMLNLANTLDKWNNGYHP
jgi:hypothetical protein